MTDDQITRAAKFIARIRESEMAIAMAKHRIAECQERIENDARDIEEARAELAKIRGE